MSAGKEIEEESFRIIEEELGATHGPEWPVIRRVVHATADFDFKEILYFHDDPIDAGIKALKGGAPVITDVEMARVGMTRGVEAQCFLNDQGVEGYAQEHGITRSAAAMRMNKDKLEGAIVAIGNAPTALFEVCKMIDEGLRPALVIGVPVGFVGAAESKEEILKYDVPAIVAKGRKGGSTVAAAIVNALARLSD